MPRKKLTLASILLISIACSSITLALMAILRRDRRTMEGNGIWYEECPECGKQMRCEDIEEEGIWEYKCSHCGYNGFDAYEDLFGSMSVPWGGC